MLENVDANTIGAVNLPNSTNTNKQQNRLLGADFVRATACLAVLAHHLLQRMNPAALEGLAKDAHSLLLFGAFGVASFFVLSGYLLARPFWRALDAGDPMPSLRKYVLRRAARILPGFYLALTVSFVVSFTLLGTGLDWGLVVRYGAGLLFISDWHWFTLFPVEFNGPLWSIGFEVTSYALLPLALMLVFAGRRIGLTDWNARALWLLIIIGVVIAHTWVVAHFQLSPEGTGWNFGLIGGARVWMPEYNPIGFFAVFALGAAAAGVGEMWKDKRGLIFDGLGVVALALSIYAILPFVPSGATDGYGRFDIPYGFPLFPFSVALLLAALPSSRVLGGVLDIAPIRFVAQISFGIYVWHYLIIELVREFLAPRFYYFGMRNVADWASFSTLVIALSFGIAAASFFWMERPILRFARNWEARFSGKKMGDGV